MASNASGNQSGDSAETWDSVDSGQSDDIENSLTDQGTADRETLEDIEEAEGDAPGESGDEDADADEDDHAESDANAVRARRLGGGENLGN